MQRIVPRPKYLISEILSRALTAISGRTYSWHIFRIELAAASHMMRRRGALYHVLYGETDFWFLGYVGRLTGNYVVASFHDGEEVLRGHGIRRRLVRSLSAVVILGESQREYFAAMLPPSRILLNRHGVNTTYFVPDQTIKKQKMVLTVGGHTRDYETFSAAIRMVWEFDPSVKFVAVSADIGHLGDPLTVPGVNHLTGISDAELLALYQEASVAAFSFEWAVANNSVLEAMSCGVPIVATDVGSVAEYVTPDAGVLFPPRDSEAMANAILRLLDETDVQSMSRNARARAARFDYETVAEELVQCYRELTGSTQPAITARA
jgi:glycosyltransferase involved in cell wall biosynthesis